ncbi:MAG: RNA methyltransferase [Ignavibacteriae bacterium]|nr:TrmH family RNA methyltransferase [Ignavibacteriota bacterium]NOG97861.1 RNA methyltransferase [Ignavibacteriota bacterium]
MRKLTHAEISKNRSTLDKIDRVKKLPVYVMLDSIRSSYNVGSIFRTSDGAMIEHLYLCGYTPAPPKKEVLKTALGSTESIKWSHEDDPVKTIEELKKNGVKICALEQTSKTILHYDLNYKEHFPICLIVGNEITGVSQELIDLCDFSIELPQYGIKQSLNAAVAYGIAVFKLREVFDLAEKV